VLATAVVAWLVRQKRKAVERQVHSSQSLDGPDDAERGGGGSGLLEDDVHDMSYSTGCAPAYLALVAD
jgi:hypothetical protein